MKSPLLQKVIFIIIFLVLNQTVQAQKKTFDSYLTETNLAYSAPKGYIEFEVDKYPYVPVKRGYSSILWYLIQNQSEEILIGFTFIPIRQYLSYKGIDPNVNLKNTALHEADTTKSKLYYYNSKELKSINAMQAVKYDLDMDTTLFEKYDKCKVVIMQRDNIGDGFIYYFYNDKSEGKIDKEIKNTSNMLKFLPDSQFNPLIYKKD
ncbi:hypothetical protein [Pedobacter segetis]|nr:hypothetical protein [Pedobacter segetis]